MSKHTKVRENPDGREGSAKCEGRASYDGSVSENGRATPDEHVSKDGCARREGSASENGHVPPDEHVGKDGCARRDGSASENGHVTPDEHVSKDGSARREGSASENGHATPDEHVSQDGCVRREGSVSENGHVNPDEHVSKDGCARREGHIGMGVRFWISHMLVAAWMIFIFVMSSQPGGTSGEISGSVSHLFMQIWNVIFFRGWTEMEILQMAEVWDYPIRKLAHMTEFGILAMLLFWMLGQYEYFKQNKLVKGEHKSHFEIQLHGNTRLLLNKRYAFAWIFAVIYAATDEFHQLFVPDRAGLFTDVCIDAFGATIALTVITVARRIILVRRRVSTFSADVKKDRNCKK